MIKKLTALVIIVAVAAGGFMAYKHFSESEVSKIPLQTVLQDASDLTTQTLVITDCFEDTRGDIPLLTKNKYIVKYRGTVDAGLDLAEAEVSEDSGSIRVKIPHCTIDEQSVNVRAEDIEPMDANFAILNPDEKSVLELEKRAEARALKYAKSEESGLLAAADKNAVNIIKSLFVAAADGREIVVEFK